MSNTSPRGLIVVVGPMFAGKTEELGRHYTRFVHAKRTVGLCKPNDPRTGPGIVSRSGFRAMGTMLANSNAIIPFAREYNVTIVDEGQFFDEGLASAVRTIMRERLIIVFGLNLDSEGVPFANMAMLMAMATEPIVQLTAVCEVCHSTNALYSQRISGGRARVEVGFDNYEPRCFECFEPPLHLS